MNHHGATEMYSPDVILQSCLLGTALVFFFFFKFIVLFLFFKTHKHCFYLFFLRKTIYKKENVHNNACQNEIYLHLTLFSMTEQP